MGWYWVKIWDHKSWVWSDLATIQLAGSPAPTIAINHDRAGHSVLLSSRGTSGRKTTLEMSSDLIEWADLSGVEPIDTGSVLDRSVGQKTARFYRLRLD